MIEVGNFNQLKVGRKSDLGYMLTDGKDDVLLHFKQSTRELKNDEKVNAFVYFDAKGRKCASMIEPYVTLEKVGLVKVVDVNENIGVFVNINMPKDVLISIDNLPYNKSLWPQIGDEVLVKLKVRKNSLLAKPLNMEEIKELKTNDERLYEKNICHAKVCRISESGIYAYTEDYDVIFVSKKNMRQKYRLSEEVEITISKVTDEGYIGTLVLQKEFMIDTDAQAIIDYLTKHGNEMPYDAKSGADIIEKEFNMSRKAFKRALGSLYKERAVDFINGKTVLLAKK